MSLKDTVLGWLLPTNLITWLNGKKTLLGIISLAIWALLYAIPGICTTTTCTMLTGVAGQIKDILASAGVSLDTSLFDAGTSLTLVGLIDKVTNHWFSNLLHKFFGKVESLGK